MAEVTRTTKPMNPIEMLRSIEWQGYDAEAGERACPNCGAWKYQPIRDRPIHAYACTLAVIIGAPDEKPDAGIFWGGTEAP